MGPYHLRSPEIQYHPDDFLLLAAQVEDEGGKLLPDTCMGRIIRMKLPDASGKAVWKRIQTTACTMTARFAIPYEEENGDTSFAPVCSVDDAMGLWPRYAKCMKSGESFEYMNFDEFGGLEDE